MNKSLVLAAVIAAVALSACGKKEEAPMVEAPAAVIVVPAPAEPAVMAPAPADAAVVAPADAAAGTDAAAAEAAKKAADEAAAATEVKK